MTGPCAVLVGLPGAGKTTVGRLLARRLGTDLLDSDALVEAAAGVPVPEVFAVQGEERFRALEADAVARALASHPGVLSLGGGAVLHPATRARLAGHPVVLLTLGPRAAAARLDGGRGRPLLGGGSTDPLVAWERLRAERAPLYASLARHTVPTDGRTPAEVVEVVAALLQEAPT